MFRESKEYKVLSEIREAMELYEISYDVLKAGKDLITRHYPSNTKKVDYLQEFRRVKDRVDLVKGKISNIPTGTEAFSLISKEIRNNLYLTDEYLNTFVDKYELNSDSDSIPVRHNRQIFKPTEDLIESLCGSSFSRHNRKQQDSLKDNIDSLRNYIDNDDINDLRRKTENNRVVTSDRTKLADYYRDKITLLKRHNVNTYELEEKLKSIEKELPQPEVRLTKNQKKRIVSPFRSKMSACHKSYNSIKDNIDEEGVIAIFQETLDIEADFFEIHQHLNEVDLNELSSLLKRIDKLALDFPGLLNYDFTKTRELIEKCRTNINN